MRTAEQARGRSQASDAGAGRRWEVLGSLSQEDLAAFLRFVWGRSRLPRPSEFTETFKIHISPPGDNRSVGSARAR